MTENNDPRAEMVQELSSFPPFLSSEFQRAVPVMARGLNEEELVQWIRDGLDLAHYSLRSWEVAAEYFRVSPQVLSLLPYPGLRQWYRWGADLTRQSSALAVSYFRASPGCLRHLSVYEMREWASLGNELYRGTWRSAGLATQFLEASPSLLSSISLSQMRMLARLVDTLAQHSYPLSSSCLDVACHVLGPLASDDRGPFLAFCQAVAETNWADTRLCIERGPGLLNHVEPSQRPRFLALTQRVVRQGHRQPFQFFAQSAEALAEVDHRLHAGLLVLAEELLRYSGEAAMDFLCSSRRVLERISEEGLVHWHAEGLQVLETNREGGEAYFRLESTRSEDVLEMLSARVDLSRISEILRMYCKALTGTNVSVQPASHLVEKGIGWVSLERPSTEGTTIYLPELVDESRVKAENFNVYKVFATHQAGHLEFGSFSFQFDRPGYIFTPRRQALEEERGGPKSPLTDVERFFDLFDDRQLASDIFAIVEDARIDFLVGSEYQGIRLAYQRRQRKEVSRRPPVEEMPLRQGFLENLVRISLQAPELVRWPQAIMDIMRKAAGLVLAVQQTAATVEDSAEATLRLYGLAQSIANVLPKDLRLEDWASLSEEDILSATPMEGEAGEQGESQIMPLMEGDEVAYQSPEPVDFRGDFKPEMVQLLMRLRETQDQEQAGQQSSSPLSAEQLKEFMEKSVEISLTDIAEGDLTTSTNLFMTNLQKEMGTPPESAKEHVTPGQMISQNIKPDDRELAQEPPTYLYDEWDFRAGDYRPRWCRVREITLPEGTPDFYEQTVLRNASLIHETRRQFELLKPEMFRKIKRLLDGEDYDLDAVLDFLVERRSGHQPIEKIYWRRNKVERNVAVAFLLDMSASTDEEISRRERKRHDDDFDDDPRKYLSWWMARRTQQVVNPSKRIIDLEKESIVLLIKALETIGDAYGIYGFSGYGRENVEFYVIKDIEETFSERIKHRIDKITPVRSTRMGPAIRHATYKLDQYDAKVKILFLLSDGRPQDHGYGRDRTEKEYAIHDTHKALVEARQKGIVPFAMTVDKEGHDYLGQMCDDIAYTVVAELDSLPSRMTTLYRKLTE